MYTSLEEHTEERINLTHSIDAVQLPRMWPVAPTWEFPPWPAALFLKFLHTQWTTQVQGWSTIPYSHLIGLGNTSQGSSRGNDSED